jgi:hypothetical protein
VRRHLDLQELTRVQQTQDELAEAEAKKTNQRVQTEAWARLRSEAAAAAGVRRAGAQQRVEPASREQRAREREERHERLFPVVRLPGCGYFGLSSDGTHTFLALNVYMTEWCSEGGVKKQSFGRFMVLLELREGGGADRLVDVVLEIRSTRSSWWMPEARTARCGVALRKPEPTRSRAGAWRPSGVYRSCNRSRRERTSGWSALHKVSHACFASTAMTCVSMVSTTSLWG